MENVIVCFVKYGQACYRSQLKCVYLVVCGLLFFR